MGTASQSPRPSQEIRLRIAKADAAQLLICVQHGLWARSRNRFRDWRVGDHLVILSDTGDCALGQVAGPPFVSEDLIFARGFFPYRIPVSFIQLVGAQHTRELAQEIRSALAPHWGARTGFPILLQLLVPEAAGKTVLEVLRARPSRLKEIRFTM